MPLPPGARLGPYQIDAAIGAGGMGEVYRARDTRLDRTVAIKVLPDDLINDEEHRVRFEREARLVASLSHPHICALHDVGTESKHAFLVMEYLEGETLADRLSRGPLPLAQVATHGAAIAHALDAAHRRGIVHRDLKPGNVMLTKSGVKLLDFGLAKGAEATPSPTLTTKLQTPATQAGVVMGTAPYMAPEQLEGKAADARSDIFALGALLYEMATGDRAFPGSSYAAVASAILTSDPPTIGASSALDVIVRTSLEKDPDRRWRSAHDIALQLEALSRRPAPNTGSRAPLLPWLLAAAMGLVALGAFAWGALRREAPGVNTTAEGPQAIAFPLPPPPGGAFTQSVEWVSMAAAPDGRAIVYSAVGSDRVARLWLRRMDSADARVLEGTEGATSSFWSPDSRTLAFFVGSVLKRLDLSTGSAPIKICDVPEGIGKMGSWGAEGQILFATVQGEALWRVPASGGTPEALQRIDQSKGETRITWPRYLPDGRSYIYLARAVNDSGGVMLATPDGKKRKIIDADTNAEYVDPGYLVFGNDSSLVARRFDPESATVTGDVIPIGPRLLHFRATGLAFFSASRNGLVVFQSHSDEGRIAAFERDGREIDSIRPVGPGYQTLSLSTDGRRLLFDRLDPKVGTLDAWVLDLTRGIESRVTTEPRTDAFPTWAPDGSVIFSVASGSAPRLFRRDLETSKEQELTPVGVGLQQPSSVSPDGQWLLYAQRTPRGLYDLMLRRLSDNQTREFRATSADESDGRFSPDGRLVAYVSDESGRPQVMLASFPSGPSTVVSAEAGFAPRWRRDGRELFFIGGDGVMMAATVSSAAAGIEIGRPARLFSTRTPQGPWGAYEVSPDGRFYASVRTQITAQQPMTVILNWNASVSR